MRDHSQPVTASFDQLSTSDYSSNVSTTGSLTRVSLDKISPGHLQADHEPADTVQRFDNCWDSDSECNHELQPSWGEEADQARFTADLEEGKCLVLTAGDCRLLLPQENLFLLPSSTFSIFLPEPSQSLAPPTSLRVHHVSPIVQTYSLKQSGVEVFPSNSPAYLILPVSVELSNPELLSCLYSDTLDPPRWLPLPRHCYRFKAGYVLFKTCCFHTLFTVIYNDSEPLISKRIRSRIGGSLIHSHGIKVKFPRGSCREDTDAYLKILYDTVPDNTAESLQTKNTLACPIIRLGPHGFRVEETRKPVEIELPVPLYREILEQFPRAELTVYESSTREGEPLEWRRLELDKQSIHSYKSGYVSISFGVYHFTFFKVVWNTIVGMGMSNFLEYASFPMNCKAYMQENPGDNSFGMEVICFNPDSDSVNSNYPYCVGSNLKPKLVKPGRLIIKLKSQKFEANVEAGEEPEMEKEESKFVGKDFEKQFSCIFKRDVRTDIERGTFGKVILDRVGENKEKLENLFEFNLNKTGNETEAKPMDNTDHWSTVAIKELAGNLGMMDELKIRKFASFIGFTQ